MGKNLSEPKHSTQAIAPKPADDGTPIRASNFEETLATKPNSLLLAIVLRRREQLTLLFGWGIVVVACIWYFVSSRGSDATVDLDDGEYQAFRYTVELNSANSAELASIPGIGARTAGAIVDWRSKNGPFDSIESLTLVDGISQKTVARIRPFFEPLPPKDIPITNGIQLKSNENRTQNGD